MEKNLDIHSHEIGHIYGDFYRLGKFCFFFIVFSSVHSNLLNFKCSFNICSPFLSPSFFPSLSDHSSFRPYLLPFKVNCRRQTRLISMHLHSLCCHSLCRVFSSWSRVEMLSINIYINNNHTWKTYVNVASTLIIMKWFSIMNALM